jgi:hypothetical protein
MEENFKKKARPLEEIYVGFPPSPLAHLGFYPKYGWW